MKDISAIIPVYNGERTLVTCLDSVIQQKCGNISFEIIIIDDGSTDGTESISRKYCERYPETIRYFRNENNLGVSEARNTGLDLCEGTFVAFIDADDYISEEYFSRLYEMADAETDLVCCAYYAVQGANCYYRQSFFEKACIMRSENDKEEFLLRLLCDDYGQPKDQKRISAVGVPWAKLFRMDVIRNNDLRFPAGLRRSEDNLFAAEYMTACRSIKYIDEPLYYYNIEHVRRAYYSFTPDDYRAILRIRDKFFELADTSFSEKVNAFRMAEKASMLNASIKNLVLARKGNDLYASVKALSGFEEFSFPDESVSLEQLAGKQKLYILLYRLYRQRFYHIVILIWKLYFAFCGTE